MMLLCRARRGRIRDRTGGMSAVRGNGLPVLGSDDGHATHAVVADGVESGHQQSRSVGTDGHCRVGGLVGGLDVLGVNGGDAAHTVVGPVGFTGGQPAPARTTLVGSCASEHQGSSGAAQDVPVGREAEMMARFRVDYLTLLDGRLAAIHRAVGDLPVAGAVPDAVRLEKARVALLSLESSSGMIGACRLVSRLHDLRVALEVLGADQRAALVAAIDEAAAEVRLQLQPS